MLTKKELSVKIGNQIKEFRKSKGISQAELGRLCKKEKQHIEQSFSKCLYIVYYRGGVRIGIEGVSFLTKFTNRVIT